MALNVPIGYPIFIVPRYAVAMVYGTNSMTSKADRRAISRAVAKAIAYHDCGKPERAAAWAAEVVRLLEAHAILTPTAFASRPE
jgi:hypothetical protein